MRPAIAAVVGALVACSSRSAPAPAALPDLSASLDAVRSEFNAHLHEARFLTLLAPT